ncbi:hypothetical protein [uncultured Methanoregula sp.]|uniref:hypothetical protein n=1 Tax=uncultured Methanoregula sp. TaxID=1005933 RepID=UPI002AAB971D|nr:hypothetical protein [uncultured Methanoregula sp.]
MAKNSIAMLDKDHHIHLIPAERVLMMSIEHSAIKKIENEHFEIECFVKLSVEGFPHPLEDAIRFSFASSKVPGQQMMTDLTFIQNHIIKYIFDKGLSGELCDCVPDDPHALECGITISSEIKSQMLASNQLRDVLARQGAFPDSLTFLK